MSKHNHNYQNHYKQNNVKPVEEINENVTPVNTVEEVEVEEEVVTAPPAATEEVEAPFIGVVVDCSKLNIRKEPSTDAPVVCVVDKGAELEIDLIESTNEWYSVCTASGLKGYCMNEFVVEKE